MKKIVFNSNDKEVNFLDVREASPVFAKRNGILEGMVVKEGQGWILRIGGCTGSYGYRSTLEECILYGQKEHNFTFHVE